MTGFTNFVLSVPASLMDDLRCAAERDGVSMNGFIIQAVAEKVSALRARGLLRDLGEAEQMAYLDERAARGQAGRMAEIIAKAGTTLDVLSGDELSDDYRPL